MPFAKSAKKLRVLHFSNFMSNLGFNEIKCDDLKFFKNAYFINLTTLYLGSNFFIFVDNNHIKVDGCYYLQKTNLQSMQTLDISNNEIDDEAAKNLAISNWPCLLNLLICKNILI
jgi:hypothetical protein